MKRSARAVATFSLLVSMLVGVPRAAEAEPMREFIMSCSYGVLAGTLVGAATLAFSDKPGDSLNKVARGASFGLYAGILLGLYVVYGVSSQEEADIREQLGYDLRPNYEPRFALAPVISERGLEGGEFRYEITRF